MNLLALLVNLLPTLFGLIHTAEASHQAPGSGSDKQSGVLDALRVILAQFPAVASKVDTFLAIVQPIIKVYVTLSNVFGWNPAVAQLAAQIAGELETDPPPAPAADAPQPAAQAFPWNGSQG